MSLFITQGLLRKTLEHKLKVYTRLQAPLHRWVYLPRTLLFCSIDRPAFLNGLNVQSSQMCVQTGLQTQRNHLTICQMVLPHTSQCTIFVHKTPVTHLSLDPGKMCTQCCISANLAGVKSMSPLCLMTWVLCTSTSLNLNFIKLHLTTVISLLHFLCLSVFINPRVIQHFKLWFSGDEA